MLLEYVVQFLGEKFAKFFNLITFRASMAAILAFLLAVIFGPTVIAWLKRKKVGERIEKKDSERLDRIMQNKKDTPTMGGIFICGSVLLSVVLFGNFENSIFWVAIGLVVTLGIVGGMDDYVKLTGINRKGISFFTKLLCQVVIGIGCGILLESVMRDHLEAFGKDPTIASSLYFPILPTGTRVDLGAFYPLFVMFVIVACSNAVNVTDGLDGLASGCLIIACFAYAIIAYVAGRSDYTSYLDIPYVPTSAEATLICTAMMGACLGFLWFNSYPAQVFMGDVGSLPIGGALGLVACVTKQELLILFVGGVFVIEIFSSFLQIFWFKATGKRVFRIAPLHHHYQFQGVPETKITLRFWIVAAVFALASLSLLKLRF